MGDEISNSDRYEFPIIQLPIRGIVSSGTLEEVLKAIEDGEKGLKERVQTIRGDAQLMSRLTTIWQGGNGIIEGGRNHGQDGDRRRDTDQISDQERIYNQTRGEEVHHGQILEQERGDNQTVEQGSDEDQTNEQRREHQQPNDREIQSDQTTETDQARDGNQMSPQTHLNPAQELIYHYQTLERRRNRVVLEESFDFEEATPSGLLQLTTGDLHDYRADNMLKVGLYSYVSIVYE
jgi:hypothetical protein